MIVDSIQVDPKFDQYSPKPDRGHRLVVSLRAETSTSYDPVRHPIPQYVVWNTIGPDGVTEASPTSSIDCHGAKVFPFEIWAAAK
jgi:hypothetical protein